MDRRRTSLRLIADARRRNACFLKRVSGIKKKAMELSTLCDIPVLLVCYGPEGQPLSWPEDHADLNRILDLYRGLAEHDRSRNSHDLGSFLKYQYMKELRKGKGGGEGISGGGCMEDMTLDGLVRVGEMLDSRLEAVRERIQALQSQKGKKRKDVEGEDELFESWQEQEHSTQLQLLLLEGNNDVVDLDTILRDTYSTTTTTTTAAAEEKAPPTSDFLANWQLQQQQQQQQWQQQHLPFFNPLSALPEPSSLLTNYILPLTALPPVPVHESHGMWRYPYPQNGFAVDGIASSSGYAGPPHYWLDHGINIISTGGGHGQCNYVNSIIGGGGLIEEEEGLKVGYSGTPGLDVIFDSWGGAADIPSFLPDPNVPATASLLPRRFGINTNSWIN